MALATFAAQSAPATPAAGNGTVYFDTTSKLWLAKNDAGRFGCLGSPMNYSTAAQGAGFATDTYVLGSNILIPGCGLQAGTCVRWTISASKTAAGVATPVYTVRIGAAGAIGDTSRLAVTGVAQTAAADIGILQILLTVRSIGAAGVIQGTVAWLHNQANAAGFGGNAIEATAAGFDNTALGGQYIGLSINGGASAAWTLTQVRSELDL